MNKIIEIDLPLQPMRITCATCKGETYTIEAVCCGQLLDNHDCCNIPDPAQKQCEDCKGEGFYTTKRL